MNSIFQILSTCTAGEKNQLLEFCATRHSASSKKYQLLKVFVEKPALKDAQISQLIYGQKENPAYYQLKKRVKEELEELLPLLNANSFSSDIKTRIRCSELLLQSQVLLARGLRCDGAKLLEKSLRTAISSDFPDLILSIFDVAQRFSVNEVIRKEDLPELELIIQSHLAILINQHHPKSEDRVPCEKNAYLGQILHQLDSERKNWGLVSTIRQSIADQNFEEAKSLILESEPSFEKNSEDREVYEEFFLTKQKFLLQTGQYQEVIQNCKHQKSGVIHSKEKHLELSQYHWYALFHQDHFDEAAALLRKDLMQRCPELSPKWKYWEAFLLFRKQSFKNALRSVHECQQELKTMPNYYLGSKMLELMILFDQNEVDWLDYKVENLRKLLHRWKGKISIRIDSAFHVLRGIQTKAPVSSWNDLVKNEHLLNLQDGKGIYHWNPIDFELIRYDGWIASRRN
ncbi:hypothetical protein [Algoriphagus terrigena]|uniref:hypothetical protein n=1 Tax=Algoriphagus terrigena TaxID=344884 RepID=UPI00047AE998|nr:hypothetical protein [Algoriphagus terrigena]